MREGRKALVLLTRSEKEESELSFFWTLLMKTRCEAPILHSQTPAVRVITAAELLPESSFFLITF